MKLMGVHHEAWLYLACVMVSETMNRLAAFLGGEIHSEPKTIHLFAREIKVRSREHG